MAIIIAFGLFALAVVIMLLVFKHNTKKEVKVEQSLDTSNVNEESFQKYAKFFGEIYPHEDKFDEKLNKIYELIKNQHMDDLNKIAELSFCSMPECVLKIKYLENKGLIDNIFIDTVNFKIFAIISFISYTTIFFFNFIGIFFNFRL